MPLTHTDNPNAAITPELMIHNTPWGPADYRRMIAPGIVFLSTPSHGGAYLSKELQDKMPAHRRTRDGWYEEDCEIAYVVDVFPELFAPEQVDYARRAIASWGARDIRMQR